MSMKKFNDEPTFQTQEFQSNFLINSDKVLQYKVLDLKPVNYFMSDSLMELGIATRVGRFFQVSKVNDKSMMRSSLNSNILMMLDIYLIPQTEIHERYVNGFFTFLGNIGGV